MYYFYLGGVLLPVAPEKFNLKVNNANKTITLINEGEINFLREAKLTDLEFECLIPSVQYPFANYDGGFKSPASYLSHFEQLKTSKAPFQFIVVRQMPNGKLLFDTNMTVSMEKYTVQEQSGQGFDLTVSFSLKQYKAYSTKVVSVTNNTATITEQRSSTNSPAPTQSVTYKVEDGDCLWNIAKAAYGDGSKWKVIYEANKDKITNPNLIYTGQVLTIPDTKTADLEVQKLKKVDLEADPSQALKNNANSSNMENADLEADPSQAPIKVPKPSDVENNTGSSNNGNMIK